MMDDRMVEGVIYCATHGKPLGECRHPVLEGEVPDNSKPVSQQQRARGGHMRAFVTRERIDSDPPGDGIRGEGAPDEWVRPLASSPSMRAKAATEARLSREESRLRYQAQKDAFWGPPPGASWWTRHVTRPLLRLIGRGA